jgi:glucuronate isomerase
MKFINDDFLLKNGTAKSLYHDHAEKMPIFDYHCHLSPAEIAEDKKFGNITQMWLYGDHYKWRAMRANGIDERFITGDASDSEKFRVWAKTVPYVMKNPLYHWTHLELARYFGIDDRLLSDKTADYIYDKCNEEIKSGNYSAKKLIRKMNVEKICTTDDPLSDLMHHKKLHEDGFETKVLPTFRPDKAAMAENPGIMNGWIDELEKITDSSILTFDDLVSAVRKRHDYFHEAGCRLSDHAIETLYDGDFTESETKKIFKNVRKAKRISRKDALKFKTAMMIEFAKMNHERGWVMQIHAGALRNNNSRRYRTLGPDTGFDSIGDSNIAASLSRFFDAVDREDKLPKTIVYNLNPRDNDVYATMIGNFQGDGIVGKLQYGSAWWFLDNKDGMERQITVLSNHGLLSRFIGMLTDSRSFLSYPRHEYFRRILCNMIGNDVENGEIPPETEFLGKMIEDICYNNADMYFGI